MHHNVAGAEEDVKMCFSKYGDHLRDGLLCVEILVFFSSTIKNRRNTKGLEAVFHERVGICWKVYIQSKNPRHTAALDILVLF